MRNQFVYSVWDWIVKKVKALDAWIKEPIKDPARIEETMPKVVQPVRTTSANASRAVVVTSAATVITHDFPDIADAFSYDGDDDGDFSGFFD